MSRNKINCPCGSIINESSMKRHLTTKRHRQYDTGQETAVARKIYQRDRLNNNPTLRQKQRDACRVWYNKNKEALLAKRRQFPCRAKIKKG